MKSSACLLGAVLALILNCAVGQTVHNVGGSLNWTARSLPNTSYYNDWAAGQTFRLGDSLVFNFAATFHDVVEVNVTSYNSCDGNNLSSIITTSPATFNLSSSGRHYYICTFTGHCQAGQRLSINVENSTSGGASPPTAAPPTSSGGANPPTAATPPTTSGGANPPAGAAPPTTPSNPSAPGSGAASLAGSFLFVLLSAGMVFVV